LAEKLRLSARNLLAVKLNAAVGLDSRRISTLRWHSSRRAVSLFAALHALELFSFLEDAE